MQILTPGHNGKKCILISSQAGELISPEQSRKVLSSLIVSTALRGRCCTAPPSLSAGSLSTKVHSRIQMQGAPLCSCATGPTGPHRDCGWQMVLGRRYGLSRFRQLGNMVPTSEELTGVEDPDHLVALQLVGPVLAQHGVAAVEHPALAQPLDQHALPATVQQHTSLQVPEQLARHLPLPLAGDGVRGREAHQLQALGPIHLGAGQSRLAQRQAAALGAGGGGLAYQLAPVVEADDHLGEGCGQRGDRSGTEEKGAPWFFLCKYPEPFFLSNWGLNFWCV